MLKDYGKAASEQEWEEIIILEKLWAQLACEGKENSLAGWCPQVSTLGCSGWTGLIQNPCRHGDRKVRLLDVQDWLL